MSASGNVSEIDTSYPSDSVATPTITSTPPTLDHDIGIEEATTATPSQNTQDETPTLDQPCILEPFVTPISEMLARDATEETWDDFLALCAQITKCVQAHFKIKTKEELDANPRPPRPANNNQHAEAKQIQRTYRTNRRKAIRLITRQESPFCEVDSATTHQYFTTAWSNQEGSTTDAQAIDPVVEQGTGINTEHFTAEEVTARVKRFENTSPGQDGITYRHWRNADPSSKTITLLLNMCLKYQDTA